MILDGGIGAWKEAGYRVIRPEAGPDVEEEATTGAEQSQEEGAGVAEETATGAEGSREKERAQQEEQPSKKKKKQRKSAGKR